MVTTIDRTTFGGFEDPDDPWNGFQPDDTEKLDDDVISPPSETEDAGPGEVTFRGVGRIAMPRVVMRDMGPLDYEDLMDRGTRVPTLGRYAGPLVLTRQMPRFNTNPWQPDRGGLTERRIFGQSG